MEENWIQKEMKRLEEKLAKTEPGTREYTEITSALRNLRDIQARDDAYIQANSNANEERDFRREELENQIKREKVRGIWMAIAGVGTIIGPIAVEFVRGFFKSAHLESLRVIEDDQGIVDKNRLNMI